MEDIVEGIRTGLGRCAGVVDAVQILDDSTKGFKARFWVNGIPVDVEFEWGGLSAKVSLGAAVNLPPGLLQAFTFDPSMPIDIWGSELDPITRRRNALDWTLARVEEYMELVNYYSSTPESAWVAAAAITHYGLAFHATGIRFMQELVWMQNHQHLPGHPAVTIKSYTRVGSKLVVEYSLAYAGGNVLELQAEVDYQTGEVVIIETNYEVVIAEGIGILPDEVGMYYNPNFIGKGLGIIKTLIEGSELETEAETTSSGTWWRQKAGSLVITPATSSPTGKTMLAFVMELLDSSGFVLAEYRIEMPLSFTDQYSQASITILSFIGDPMDVIISASIARCDTVVNYLTRVREVFEHTAKSNLDIVSTATEGADPLSNFDLMDSTHLAVRGSQLTWHSFTPGEIMSVDGQSIMIVINHAFYDIRNAFDVLKGIRHHLKQCNKEGDIVTLSNFHTSGSGYYLVDSVLTLNRHVTDGAGTVHDWHPELELSLNPVTGELTYQDRLRHVPNLAFLYDRIEAVLKYPLFFVDDVASEYNPTIKQFGFESGYGGRDFAIQFIAFTDDSNAVGIQVRASLARPIELLVGLYMPDNMGHELISFIEGFSHLELFDLWNHEDVAAMTGMLYSLCSHWVLDEVGGDRIVVGVQGPAGVRDYLSSKHFVFKVSFASCPDLDFEIDGVSMQNRAFTMWFEVDWSRGNLEIGVRVGDKGRFIIFNEVDLPKLLFTKLDGTTFEDYLAGGEPTFAEFLDFMLS
ncbi:MAG: hypothetical protein JW839_00795 [Candidatus Lokiarchaeota archaeon]|nr:hypothetical protein [Candidatus Lokiarchaeota archaeon]